MSNIPYAEVIGDPIAQSKSPLIHTFWLEALGLPGDYRRAHVKPDELAAYIENRRADPDRAWSGTPQKPIDLMRSRAGDRGRGRGDRAAGGEQHKAGRAPTSGRAPDPAFT